MNKKLILFVLFLMVLAGLFIYYLIPSDNKTDKKLSISKEYEKSSTTINDKNIKDIDLNKTTSSKELQDIKNDLQDIKYEIDEKISDANAKELLDQTKEQEAEDIIAQAEFLSDKLEKNSDINLSKIKIDMENEKARYKTDMVPPEYQEKLEKVEKVIEKVIENYEEIKE